MSWKASDVRVDHQSPVSHDPEPSVAARGWNVVVAWFGSAVYANRTFDGGSTWLSSDSLLSGSQGGGSPVAVGSGSDFAVVWSAGDVFWNRSYDSGTSWLAAPRKVNASSTTTTNPDLASSADSIFVVWQDSRSGKDDPYFNLAMGLQPYGFGKPGTGGLTPQMSGSGMPFPGNVPLLNVSNGLGGAAGALFVGSGQGSIPAMGGTLLVWPLALANPLPLVLGGTPGTPGVGSTTFPLTVPLNPSLVGALLTFQALFLDPGATVGISMTNGLGMWMG